MVLIEEVSAGYGGDFKFLAFDLEIASVQNGPIDPLSDLGITCSATLDTSAGQLLTWHGGHRGDVAASMSEKEACWLVDYMLYHTSLGHPVVTWNGSGFDFPVLATASKRHKDCAYISLNHIDLMFLVVVIRGHRLGIAAVAEALGYQKGTDEVSSGSKAPELWRKGEYSAVLKYVAQDAILTYQVANHLFNHSGFPWISKKGNSQNFSLPFHIYRGRPEDIGHLCVGEMMAQPEPLKPAWMSALESREKYTGWAIGQMQE